MRRTTVLAAALAVTLVLAPASLASNDPWFSQQWALEKIGAPQAGATSKGQGVIVAIVDSGVDLGHPDLAPHLVEGRNFADSGPPQDDHGHGTHVAGVAGAIADNGVGVAGVAPETRIMPVRVLRKDADGRASGSLSDVTAGIRWAVDNGARVVNLSLSEGVVIRNVTGGVLAGALRYAWDKGAVPVVAGGNDEFPLSGYRDAEALVVAATTRQDTRPSYSNGVGAAQWGISAPGGAGTAEPSESVLSTWTEGRYAYASGTSMAAPHVSGAAAALMATGLTNAQTVDRLLQTAKDLGLPGRDPEFGAGRLDLAAAVQGLTPVVGGAAGQPAVEPAPAPAGEGAPTSRPGRATSDRSSSPPGTVVVTEPPAPETADAPSPSRGSVGAAGGSEDTRTAPGAGRNVLATALVVFVLAAGAAGIVRARRRT